MRHSFILWSISTCKKKESAFRPDYLEAYVVSRKHGVSIGHIKADDIYLGNVSPPVNYFYYTHMRSICMMLSSSSVFFPQGNPFTGATKS